MKIWKSRANFKGGGVFLENIKDIYLKESEFVENEVFLNENLSTFDKLNDYYLSFGGAIYLNNMLRKVNIHLENSQFMRNKASNGGCIYI